MLRGILYETVLTDAEGAIVRLLPESPVYQGHFPGYPITPGVCLVQIALELIEEMAGQAGHDELKGQAGHDELKGQAGHDELKGRAGDDGKAARLVAAKNIKFVAPVFPAEGTELRFNLSGKDGNWSVDVYNGEVLSAKMSLVVE